MLTGWNQAGMAHDHRHAVGDVVAGLVVAKDAQLALVLGDLARGRTVRSLAWLLTLFDDVGGQKGNQNLGSWSTGNPSQQPSEVIRVTNNGTGIKINGTNNTAAEVDYFFSVNGTDGAATFSSDPELKVKRTTGGT